MRSSSLFLLALVAGITALAGVWMAVSSGGDSGEAVPGGRYVEGIVGKPQLPNPLFAGLNRADQSVVSLVFAGLTRLDAAGRPVPDLAESWTTSPDGLTYVFLLRPGLLWQDGTPLTAGDVVFTYTLIQELEARPSQRFDGLLAEASFEATDSRTIRVSLKEPFAPLPAFLAIGILPQHLASGSDLHSPESAFNRNPVGAGPFSLTALDETRAVLQSNPLYHFSPPYLQEIELRFIENEALLLSELKAGGVEGALFQSGLDEREVVGLEEAGNRVTRLLTRESAFLYLNLNNARSSDRRLRQALFYALDRDALAGSIYGGVGVRLDSPLGGGIWSATAALDRYEADLIAADLLLEEAGWVLIDGQRVRGGEVLTFTLITDRDPVRTSVAERVAESWRSLGIVVEVEILGGTTLVRDFLEPRLFDVALVSVDLGPDPDPYSHWHSGFSTGKGSNLSSLRDDNIDALLEEGRRTSDDQRRETIYAEFQEAFAQELPSFPLYSTAAAYVQPASVQGTRLGLLLAGGGRFWQVHEWYVQTR